MKAVYINSFSSLDDLEIREVPQPSPAAGQVLVRVRAAGLNRADLLQAKGLYPPPAGYSANIPGLEFAGEVAELGDGVDSWDVGDRVFGITAGESQAEYLITEQRHLARIPDALSFVEAAAVPEAFITAQDAIISQGKLVSGETLLVHAVGSGVGLAALRIGKMIGARVIGTSRTSNKLDRCMAFGLDRGIATGDEPEFSKAVLDETDDRGTDVVLDLVGAAYFQENLASLAVRGRLILVGLTSGRTAEFNLGLALQKRLTIIGTVLRGRSSEEKAAATRSFADQIVPAFADGRLRPDLDRVFAAHDVLDAYRYLASNQSFGKVVLEF
ncbi:MAG: NAD(P)H-quinone oxidoreductase [Pyrinomonadaceae bacterium]|nr:NAD(P)H-quinone oxidoreductase [Pyrinomonadaceae bacterium]MBP6213130.1 NAD(P)H-quinone oxidoreductase [Pyrinomonadaceae bacterium]